MNFEKTFYVMGPDEEGDRDIHYYKPKMNKLYESAEPAQRALNNIIDGYKRLVKYDPMYQDYVNRLEKKQVLEVKVTIVI